MRGFIIFFEAKEGTSPLVRILDNFKRISMIHQVDNSGWEPFDRHNCGPMSLGNLERCLDIVFNRTSIDFKRLNQIYGKTATRLLEEIGGETEVVGFKMRFKPPRGYFPRMTAFSRWSRLPRIFAEYHARPFERMMMNLLRRNDVVVCLAVRQDVLRWGLSEYHGDGTGKPGHLQFKLAKGEFSKDDMGKIRVDCTRLKAIITKLEESHIRKRRLVDELNLAGIRTHLLLYEDFLTDKQQYFSQILDFLELETSKEELDSVLRKGAYFKKVHSDDISDFVENHEEVQEKFGDRFVSWS